MLSWCPCLRWCTSCWPSRSTRSEVVLLNSSPLAHPNHSYTVRRISSFGQTFINDKGEEVEVARHGSIMHRGNDVPWRPSPIQPGVTHSDVAKRLNRMPSIEETTAAASKEKGGWKKEKIKSFSPLRTKKLKMLHDNSADGGGPETDLNASNENAGKVETFTSPMSTSSPDLPDLGLSEEELSQNDLNLMKPLQFRRCSATAVKNSWLKAQSMMNLVGEMKNMGHSASRDDNTSNNSSSDLTGMGDEISLKSNSESLAKQFGLDLSLYTDAETGGEMPTVTAHFIPPVATIHFTAHVIPASKTATISLERLEGLAGEGGDNSPFQIIIKLGLIKGGPKTVYSTRPVNSVDRINQAFSFSVKDVNTSILRMSLYNSQWDEGTHDSLGHALIRISSIRTIPSYFSLDMTQKSLDEDSTGVIHFCYNYQQNNFNLRITKLSDLAPNIRQGKIFVKVCYYSMSKKVKEKVCRVLSSSSSTVDINFDVRMRVNPLEDQHSFFVISVKRKETVGTTHFFRHDRTIGMVRIGPLFYKGPAPSDLTPWGQALLHSKTINLPVKMIL